MRHGDWLLVRVPILAASPWRTLARMTLASAVAASCLAVVAHGAWRLAHWCELVPDDPRDLYRSKGDSWLRGGEREDDSHEMATADRAVFSPDSDSRPHAPAP